MTSGAKKMLMSRRLQRSEAHVWTAIPCEDIGTQDAPLANKCFASFLELDDSLAYIASVDGQLVGGTALYRDRKRLSIGLLAVRMSEGHRADTVQPLIKSSLPFFRTAGIRETDVLVTDIEADSRSLPFPIGYELPNWTTSLLPELGFKEAGKMFSCRIEDICHVPSVSQIPKLQEEAIIDDFRQLMWKNRKKSGANSVQPSAALSLSHRLNALYQVSSPSGTKAMFTFNQWNKTAKIDCIQTEEASMLENELTTALAGMVRSHKSSSVLMPLLGSGQRCVAKALADAFGSEATFRTLRLMRKRL